MGESSRRRLYSAVKSYALIHLIKRLSFLRVDGLFLPPKRKYVSSSPFEAFIDSGSFFMLGLILLLPVLRSYIEFRRKTVLIKIDLV